MSEKARETPDDKFLMLCILCEPLTLACALIQLEESAMMGKEYSTQEQERDRRPRNRSKMAGEFVCVHTCQWYPCSHIQMSHGWYPKTSLLRLYLWATLLFSLPLGFSARREPLLGRSSLYSSCCMRCSCLAPKAHPPLTMLMSQSWLMLLAM